jgi:hypothetical protein
MNSGFLNDAFFQSLERAVVVASLPLPYCTQGAMQDPQFEQIQPVMRGALQIDAGDVQVDERAQTGRRARFAPRARDARQQGAQRPFNAWLVRRHRAHRGRLRAAAFADGVAAA